MADQTLDAELPYDTDTKEVNKVIHWLLGAMLAVLLGIAGIMASETLSHANRIDIRLDSINTQLSNISSESSARSQQLNDQERRMQRLEEKIDALQRYVR